MVSSPTIYTVDPSVSFVDALASGLLKMAGGDPVGLAEMTVLVPNRRAQRSLQDAFLRLLEHRTTLLPVMRPIGDVDEEEINFLGAGMPVDPSDIPPAIASARRQTLLMRQVMAWGGFGEKLAPAQGWRLAEELAKFMDQVDTKNLSYETLTELVPESLSEHWDITLQFLKIVTEAWPLILEAEGAINPVVRRDALLRMLASVWHENPPKGKLVAAGSTGSIPATAELLSVVARLPEGMVILPGVDHIASDECWDLIDPTHPQTAMKNLLETMGASRHEIEPWSHDLLDANYGRSKFFRDALLPAALTRNWRQMNYRDKATEELFAGIDAIVAPTRREEADSIAVLMREVLEEPGKTAALVTPDRQLARHVRASLGRWGIDIDDSGGDRALNTVPGRLFGLIATAVSDRLAPVPFLAVLQHPLVSLGRSRQEYLEFVHRLDHGVLRGVRPAGGADGLLKRASVAAEDGRNRFQKDDIPFLEEALDAFLPLLGAFDSDASLSELLRAHIECAEMLAANDTETGSDALWRGEAGLALADSFAEHIEQTADLKEISAESYAPLFAEMLSPAMVRPVWRKHPRLSIWGPLEARLQRADVMVLGGLNEGVWPGEIKADSWMNRQMRREYGLPPLERRMGQSAHDFMQAASGGKVYLTRAEKVDGSPTVPSRWWFRIEALAGREIPRAEKYVQWAGLLAKTETKPVRAPAPRPPLEARPKRLSVTQVEQWMRDPYGLYAKQVLGLRTLDPVDDRPNAAQKGTLLHEALELFLKERGAKYGDEGLERLIAVGRRVFEPVITQPAVYAFWWPRFEHIAKWFVANEEKRQKSHEVALVEGWGEATVPHTDFKVFAKADRIDRVKESGKLEIIDYKTGNIPTAKRVAAGFAPQLPLEAWLAEVGGFDGITASAVEDLIFWELKGGDPIQRQAKPIKDIEHAVWAAEDGLRRLVEAFSNEGTPYLSNPRPSEAGYGDYDHLARAKEWRGSENTEDNLSGALGEKADG
ncbi:double-strand break repair protein AddB [Kordiimonas sp. SCSIO 12603]|uniref:double-strand break repair protein AddB n=1 Tax=Kordiimonas sp. SCSIO 12603 TaxID=2829596 RepID=UPI0021067DB9|nr:double-strand break repair protein AddB [Kordiimonas sp. SCSIO 12603]UTW58582.1 double-strand break repair protein AddB [Kordiimonas sp. SCSIO 12603]